MRPWPAGWEVAGKEGGALGSCSGGALAGRTCCCRQIWMYVLYTQMCSWPAGWGDGEESGFGAACLGAAQVEACGRYVLRTQMPRVRTRVHSQHEACSMHTSRTLLRLIVIGSCCYARQQHALACNAGAAQEGSFSLVLPIEEEASSRRGTLVLQHQGSANADFSLCLWSCWRR